MQVMLRRFLALALILMPMAAQADPVSLKLAYFSSDRAIGYRAVAKSFVEAVNAEGKGSVEVVLYAGGVLGRDIGKQPKVVLDGVADIAFVVPGYTPELFPDNALIELPGIFRSTREGTLAYTRLIAQHALAGYDDFVVLGAYVTEPETIHSRLPIESIGDLKGKRIRVNNTMGGAALQLLGATPVLMPITGISNAISSGAIDAACVNRTALADYGIKRVATYHYMLGTSGAPLGLLMNRKKFESLPTPVQELIRKYSGEWLAERFIATYEASDNAVSEQINGDEYRRVVYPSKSDLERADVAFSTVISGWVAESSRHVSLLSKLNVELTKLRSAQ